MTVFECRDYRHAWEPMDAGKEPGGWWRIMRCSRCRSTREEHLNKRGEIIDGVAGKNRKYQYVPGFLRKPGSGRMTEEEKGALRLYDIQQVIKAQRNG